MKLATFNINNLNKHLPHLLARLKTWMPGTSPGMTKLFECLLCASGKRGDCNVRAAAPDLI